MIRLLTGPAAARARSSRLPDISPDPPGLPDGALARPSIGAVFDTIAQENVIQSATSHVTDSMDLQQNAVIRAMQLAPSAV